MRAADADELAILAEIDARADTVFRVAGYDLPEIPFDEAALRDAAAVFVIGRPPSRSRSWTWWTGART